MAKPRIYTLLDLQTAHDTFQCVVVCGKWNLWRQSHHGSHQVIVWSFHSTKGGWHSWSALQPADVGMHWGSNVRSAARFKRWLTFLAYADGLVFLSWSADTSQLLDCIKGFCLCLGWVVSTIINDASLFIRPSMPVSSLGKPLLQMSSLKCVGLVLYEYGSLSRVFN